MDRRDSHRGIQCVLNTILTPLSFLHVTCSLKPQTSNLSAQCLTTTLPSSNPSFCTLTTIAACVCRCRWICTGNFVNPTSLRLSIISNCTSDSASVGNGEFLLWLLRRLRKRLCSRPCKPRLLVEEEGDSCSGGGVGRNSSSVWLAMRCSARS